jgi:thiosulfate reductase cytochrome b subunit
MNQAVLECEVETGRIPHARWVRIAHWLVAVSLVTLGASGFVILMAHPRLYWGETGNDLTPPLVELPISRNYKHNGWEQREPFFQNASSPISANRTYDIFNQNGWGRSLHFLAAWLLVGAGVVYVLRGILSGHFRSHIWPGAGELNLRLVWRDVTEHLHLRIRSGTGGPQYGLLQKCTYCVVIFLAVPLAVMSGLTMSPAITAAFPFLLRVFGGYQSARTIHFLAFSVLILFVIAHVVMVAMSGFRRQMRAMIFGR